MMHKWHILKVTVCNGMFRKVCVLHVKLRSRLFVLCRMSCLRGRRRREPRKRDVASADCWAGSQPVRNRFLLTQLSVWTMFAVIMLQMALEALGAFTANTGELGQLNTTIFGRRFYLNKHWASELISTVKLIDCSWPTNTLTRKHSIVWPWIRPPA